MLVFLFFLSIYFFFIIATAAVVVVVAAAAAVAVGVAVRTKKNGQIPSQGIEKWRRFHFCSCWPDAIEVDAIGS